MINTSLCYIEKDGQYLMLHRTKKKQDYNKNKWIGIGGKFLENESPLECVCREAYEETGLTLNNCKLRSVITFVSNEAQTEQMFLFHCTDFSGELIDCNEGELAWIPIPEIFNLNLWEGDKVFLKKMMDTDEFFLLKLVYEGDTLVTVQW